MNVKLLRKVAKHILAEPKRLNMAIFGTKIAPAKGGPRCKTVGCIAGWAVMLEDKSMMDVPFIHGICRTSGMNALRVDNDEAQKLFYTEFWPTHYAVRYEKEKTKQGKALVVAERIEHFIKTKGKE